MLTLRSTGTQLALCALNGAFFVLVWPPSSWCVLTPVLMVPFLLLWFPHRHRLLGVVMAYLFFLPFTLIALRWMFGLQVGTAGMALIVMALVLIPVVQSLPYIFFRLLGRKLRGIYWVLLIPVLNALIEMAHYHWDLAFTWLHMGLSLSSAWPTAGGFGTFGIDGVSLLVYMANVLAMLSVAGWQSGRKPWVTTVGFLLVIAMLFIPLQTSVPDRGRVLKVAIAEPVYDPNEYREDELYRHSRIIREALEKSSASGVELAVFPEGYLRNFGSHPVLLDDWDRNPALREIREWCKAFRINLITGAIGIRVYAANEPGSASARLRKDGVFYDMQNVVLLVDSNGGVQYRAKSRLVPFMERVPFLETFEGLENMHLSINSARGSYLDGAELSCLDLGGLRILPLICYESLFNREVSAAMDEDVDLIVEVSNEAWTSDHLMTEQHAAYAKASSLAYERPYVRSAVISGSACYRCGDKVVPLGISGGRMNIFDVACP